MSINNGSGSDSGSGGASASVGTGGLIAASAVKSVSKQKRITKMIEKKALKLKVNQIKQKRRKLGPKTKIENDGVRKELSAELKSVKQILAEKAAADQSERETFQHMTTLFEASAAASDDTAMSVVAAVETALIFNATAKADSKSNASNSSAAAASNAAPFGPSKFAYASQPSKNDRRRAKSLAKAVRGSTPQQQQAAIMRAVATKSIVTNTGSNGSAASGGDDVMNISAPVTPNFKGASAAAANAVLSKHRVSGRSRVPAPLPTGRTPPHQQRNSNTGFGGGGGGAAMSF